MWLILTQYDWDKIFNSSTKHIVADSSVSLPGVLQYCKMALSNLSMFRLPLGPTLIVTSQLIVLIPTSALQLLIQKQQS